jgi:tRNA-specific 2-thiouridylase
MRVIVGMSGGVDSAVSAALLVQQGQTVEAVFMKNWQDDDQKFCTAEQDYADVRAVCEQIGIPYFTYNFEKEYWEHVFQLFLDAFQKGYTPNPDILCNQEIKFNFFLKKALKSGADKIATGHYAQIVANPDGSFDLLKGADTNKDQSYFLCRLTQAMLAKTIFPIGHLAKSEVRRIAAEQNLKVKDKKDSTGICFVGERDFRDFLKQFIPATAGDIIDLNGKKVGTHTGSMYYTIGQRKGLNIGGPGEPWFVCDKDVKANTITVCQGENHPALLKKTVITEGFHFINKPIAVGFVGAAKIRYRQMDQACILQKIDSDGNYHFEFTDPQRAVTLGQELVLYAGDICLGGGMIIGSI